MTACRDRHCPRCGVQGVMEGQRPSPPDLATARELLAEHEWCDWDGYFMEFGCAHCHRTQGVLHRADCELAVFMGFEREGQ